MRNFAIMSFNIFFIAFTSCKAQEHFRPGGPYYYESFANYEIPFRPIGELSADEAKLRDAYYVAYFNNNSKIVTFTKYLKGEIVFSDKYIYSRSSFLEQRELTKSTGEIVIQYFDKKGKIIQK